MESAPSGEAWCPICGITTPDGRYCPVCVAMLDDVTACPGCGHPSDGDICPACEKKVKECLPC